MELTRSKIVIMAAFLALFGAGCTPSVSTVAESSKAPSSTQEVPMTPAPPAHGVALTSEQAGITPADLYTLDRAYITAIKELNGKKWVTIDPVTFVDCQTPRNAHKNLPKGCDPNNPDQGSMILDPDPTTYTFEMATSAGPYFINAISDTNDGKEWRTMDLPTMQGLIAGSIPADSTFPDYYDVFLHADPAKQITPNTFLIQKKGNVITKAVQVYRE